MSVPLPSPHKLDVPLSLLGFSPEVPEAATLSMREAAGSGLQTSRTCHMCPMQCLHRHPGIKLVTNRTDNNEQGGLRVRCHNETNSDCLFLP